MALADDIGRHVEELLTYLSITVRVDPSGSLLCVQQVGGGGGGNEGGNEGFHTGVLVV